MRTFIILSVLISIAFVLDGLIKISWKNDAKEKLDSIKKERLFWRMINGYNGMYFNLCWIFRIYLDPRHLVAFLTSTVTSHKPLEISKIDEDAEIKKLISQKKGIGNITILRAGIEKRESFVEHFIEKDDQTFTKPELEKIFDSKKDEIIVTGRYDKFVEYYFRCLPKGESHKYTKLDVWEARKELNEKAGDLEWKTEDEKVDAETMFSLKKAQEEIGEVVINILCKNINDDNKEGKSNLEKNLIQWGQLQMLAWCIVDYSVAWNGTNRIQQFMWKVLGFFF